MSSRNSRAAKTDSVPDVCASPRIQAEKELPRRVQLLLHPFRRWCLGEVMQLSVWCLDIQVSRCGINLTGFRSRKW